MEAKNEQLIVNDPRSQNNDEIESTIYWFSQIYLGGIPRMITGDSAFLSFIAVLTAIEALAGYRYSNVKSSGHRFTRFVINYLPDEYESYADELWRFRNGIVHAFTTAKFALTHHHSECHLKTLVNGIVVLNAEDFYGAVLWAAQKYFAEVRKDPALGRLLVSRLTSCDGGGIAVGLIVLDRESRTTSD